jgi:hypothetical protein
MRPIDPELIMSLSDSTALVDKLLEIEHDADVILRVNALNDYNRCAPGVRDVMDAVCRSTFQIKEDVAKCVRLEKLPHTLPAIKTVTRHVLGCYSDAIERTRILWNCQPGLVSYLNDAL